MHRWLTARTRVADGTARSQLRRRRLELALIIGVAVLSACGSGSPPRNAPEPSPTSTVPLLGSYLQPPIDAQLSLTNTYAAHDQGFTGSGVIIGVVDSGIMRSNPSVSGRVLQELMYVDPAVNNTSIDDVVGHGTMISEIAAGTSFAQFPGGVAPGANMVSARVVPDNGDRSTVQASGPQDAQLVSDLNSDLMSSNTNVMDNAWNSVNWSADDTAVTQAFDSVYSAFVNPNPAIGWRGGLVVFGAGDDSQAIPSTLSALPSVANDTNLKKGWLTVVAFNSNSPTQLASYSDQCGLSMNYCLAAPGDVVALDKDATSSTTSPSYHIVESTSVASSIVSGAAALVWQAYPYFTNEQVAQTLLTTATPLGAPPPNPVFGQGAVNVGSAVNGPAGFIFSNMTTGFSGTSSWNNPISGTYGLTFQGPGTLNLTQPSRYTGATNVEAGTLNVVSLAGNVTTNQGAVLGPSGPTGIVSIGGSVVNNGVFVARGGNTNVSGNYSQGTTGRLALSLDSAVNVTGAATLSGDLYVYACVPGYAANGRIKILSAEGGLTGSFASLDYAPGAVVSATLSYDANNVWLNVTSTNCS